MGECIITRRGGDKPTLPVLNENYPQDKGISFIQGNNGTASFNIVIQEDGKPAEYTYQWYLDGSAISGATNGSYTWSGASGGTHYIYCTVTNKAGVVTSRTATLTATMYYTPVLNGSYPADQTVEYNGSANFSVSISTAGNPSTYTYQWYNGSTAINGATGSSYTASGYASGTYSISCKVTNSAGTVSSRTATFTVGSAIPDYTYSGSSSFKDQGNGNWELWMTSSGTLKFTNRGTGVNGIDVFVCGGGGGGGSVINAGMGGAGGGGGRTTNQYGVSITKGTNYTISVGGGGGSNGGGGASSATFGGTVVQASGGGAGTRSNNWTSVGGSGGSGGGGGANWDGGRTPGDGGTNGGNGGTGDQGTDPGGSGQGTTTKMFGGTGSSTDSFSGGGGGGACGSARGANSSTTAAGGAKGGGGSWSNATWYGSAGGGGNYWNATWNGGGAGFQGIVIIRNKR